MTAPLLIDGCQINNWDREVLTELRTGRVGAVHATCAVWEDARRAIDRLLDWQSRFMSHADLIVPARTASDIIAAHASGRTAVVLGFQNTAPLEDDPRLVGLFRDLGVRIIQLTYNAQNAVGGSCFETADSGLSRFGRRVVAEMNRAGVLVDCAHVGDRTTRDAIEASATPIAITHANPRWFCDSPRNKPDAILNALVERGGVVGVTLYPHFIGGPTTTLEQFAGMIVKLADQVGIQHVAFGSDLARKWTDHDLVELRNGRLDPQPPSASWPAWPDWFRSAADFPRLLEGLARAGLADDEVAAVAGGNWLRLFKTVWTET